MARFALEQCGLTRASRWTDTREGTRRALWPLGPRGWGVSLRPAHRSHMSPRRHRNLLRGRLRKQRGSLWQTMNNKSLESEKTFGLYPNFSLFCLVLGGRVNAVWECGYQSNKLISEHLSAVVDVPSCVFGGGGLNIRQMQKTACGPTNIF